MSLWIIYKTVNINGEDYIIYQHLDKYKLMKEDKLTGCIIPVINEYGGDRLDVIVNYLNKLNHSDIDQRLIDRIKKLNTKQKEFLLKFISKRKWCE